MTTVMLNRAPRAINPSSTQTEPLAASPGQHFSPEVEAELAQSDHEAWTAVCTILLAIVSMGLIIGIGAVLLTL